MNVRDSRTWLQGYAVSVDNQASPVPAVNAVYRDLSGMLGLPDNLALLVSTEQATLRKLN